MPRLRKIQAATWAALSAVLVLLMGVLSPFLLRMWAGSNQIDYLAQLGDWVGGTSAPLIGFAGLLVVLAAFLLQRDELAHTKETLRSQQFESTFFSLLRFHHDIVARMGKEDESSRQFFGRIVKLLATRRLQDLNDHRGQDDFEEHKEDLFIDLSYPVVFEEQQGDLAHYFRNLYHIVRFLHTSPLLRDDQERYFYARLVRAQLSAYELLLLFYNAMVPDVGHPKFHYLVDRYDLLQNLDPSLVFHERHRERFRELWVEKDPLNDVRVRGHR